MCNEMELLSIPVNKYIYEEEKSILIMANNCLDIGLQFGLLQIFINESYD